MGLDPPLTSSKRVIVEGVEGMFLDLSEVGVERNTPDHAIE